MTKMTAKHIYGKNLKKSENLLLWNQKTDDLETWYAASSTTKLLKWWPWVDPDLFYGKVKFGPLCFCVGEKGKTVDISDTIVVYDVKVCRCN